ncbi:Condensin complex subunit 2 [Lonchura striata]|uniref:Condensin complex subunit 2 n=1 Tax=Lonchura striata TaxID=40157 RepID=A0A218U7X3_9PASE|nr:Condensin complex subunit 2 [Lonchura striata domestica]
MTEILNQKNSELTNFQVAAGTLDASAKIYAVRVDCVHADAFRVLGHLGKETAPARDPDSPQQGSSPAPGAAKKSQPKKKQNFKTIEQNLSNINMPEGSRRAEVDPMFQRAAASFDECNTAGIFLTGLRSQSFQSRLLFHSGIVPLPSSESLALPSSQPVTVPALRALLAPCLEKRRICSSLAGFQFTKWDEEAHDESVSALLEKFRRSEQAFDPNLDPDSEDGEGWAPSQPEFQPESPAGDGSREFPASGDGDSLGRSKRGSGAPLGEGDIGTLSLHVSLNPGEYSYFSPRVLSMWAGPEHWRFRPRQPPSGPEKDSRQRISRKVFELDFQEDIDFQAHFQKTKASTTLAKSILEKQNSRSTTLPADFNYNPQNLRQLFLKPLLKLSPSSDPVGVLDSEAGVEDYDYNNPNDTTNFCPALQVPDSDDDPDPAEFLGQAGPLPPHPEAPERSGIDGGNVPGCTELELIAEPHKIQKISIQYARTAKRMDMRRLKRNMWELLTEQGEGEEGEEGTDKEMAGDKTLSDLTKDLLHRLPPTMATNLSVPLAFVCLLHLANEKNLKLESTEDLSDILVRAGD